MIAKFFSSDKLIFKDYTILNSFEKFIIFSWRNDPKIRQEMANPKPITTSEHLMFLKNLQKNPNKKYFYVSNTRPLGSINLTNIKKESAELGIYVSPKLIGKGYGTKILKAFLKQIKIKKIWLKVKKQNQKAIKFYKKMGFAQTKMQGDFLYFELTQNL